MPQTPDQATTFYLTCPAHVALVECFRITHPALPGEEYLFTHTDTRGSTVMHEDGTQHFYQYCPLTVQWLTRRTDLQTGMKATVGDVGEDIPAFLDRIEEAGGLGMPIVCEYRSYRSDKLDTIIEGPLVYGIYAITRDEQASSFEVQSRPMNHSGTGRPYDLDEFQLRGFI